jgi:hypothetical protein
LYVSTFGLFEWDLADEYIALMPDAAHFMDQKSGIKVMAG